MMTYMWGDSIGQGVVYDSERKRYRLSENRLAKILPANGFQFQNFAKMGNTIQDGLRDMQTREVIPGSNCIIEFGGNDCDLDWQRVSDDPSVLQEGRVPVGLFAQTLRAFIHSARSKGMNPIVAVPTPLMSESFCSWVSRGRNEECIRGYLGDTNHIYRWQEVWANTVRDVAMTEHCPILDLRTPMLCQLHLPAMMCEDGIHLNDAGYQVLSDTVSQYLGKMERKHSITA